VSRLEEVRVFKPGLDGGSGDGLKIFLVGFDPGVTTGWCAMRIQLDSLLSLGFGGVASAHPDPELFSWAAGYFSGPEPYQCELMMALLRGTWLHGEGVFDAGPDSDRFVVAIEGFNLRVLSSDTDLLSPERIWGGFRQLAWRTLRPPLVTQLPVDAMRVFTDARLKAMNLWSGPPGKIGDHQRDATRHAGLLARSACDPRWLISMEERMPWLGENN